jgi:ribosomal protein S18 acetylase RimI-like enzyme
MVAINMRMLKSLPQYNPGSALNLPKALLIEKLKTSRQPGMNNQSQSAAISFQTATLPDAPVLASFVRKYYEFDGIAFVRDQVESGLNTLLADASLGQAWLILSGAEPVGYVIFSYGFDIEFGGRLALITDLYLEPPYRHRGIGRRILEQVEAHCQGLGLHGLELQVETDNAAARALYKKFGFEAADRIPMSKRIKKP